MRVLGAGILVMIMIASGSNPTSTAAPASTFTPPFTRTWTGPHASPWFHLVQGIYDVSERNRPLSCAGVVALIGTNGYHVVDIRPNFLPDAPTFHRGGKRWTGWTAHLIGGTYRFLGQRVTQTCTWSVRITRSTARLKSALTLPRSTLAGTARNPVPLRTVVSRCGAHPDLRQRLWIRGWFVPSIKSYNFTEGGLFASPHAVPPGEENRWDLNGRWKRYGALYARITTQASFGTRWVTLHGRVDCTTFRFVADHDPFPPPTLKPVYHVTFRGPNVPATTSVTAGGLELTLTVPRRSYPMNALIQVRVTIRNVSWHRVDYWTTGVALAGVAAPQAEVLKAGKVVFPPAMPFAPALPGPPPSLVPLKPGQQVAQREFVILRGDRLRGSQAFIPHPSKSVTRAANTLVTRTIPLLLHAATAPRLFLRQTAYGPVLEVTRPPGIRGRPLALTYADCGAPIDFRYSLTWVPAGTTITPDCAPVLAWHVRLAWLGEPVAALDYAPPPPSPTPTGTPSAADSR